MGFLENVTRGRHGDLVFVGSSLTTLFGPRDVIASTWYSNKTRIRTWDHFLVVVNIEGKEMRMRKGKKRWAGWTSVSDVEEKKFQELSLCPDGPRSWIDVAKEDGLEALQSRLERAVVLVKATTTAYSNKKKFMVPDEIREMAASEAQCRGPVRRKVLRKKVQKARREFDATVGALPRGKVIKRPVVTKLWFNGGATEDREEWNEEVRLHCEKCYDDKSETPEVQAQSIREQRCRGDSVVAFQGRQVVNRVLRARGKMLSGKSNGPANCLVVEMLSRLLTVVIYEVTHWFQRRFRGTSRAPEAWRIQRLVFL